MDNTELHYLTYDPDEIWNLMLQNYVNAGGGILYPGDEKEMLLRSVQADIVQVFAGVDNALRMQTLRYAAGDYLDIIGDLRGCDRIQATAANAAVTITANATGSPTTLEAGTAMTCDGEVFYLLEEDLTLSGLEETVTVDVVADRDGTIGNGLPAGAQMTLAVQNDAVSSIVVSTSASGGDNREADDVYRERIRLHTLTSITTGPAALYESAAKEVSSIIVDAKAVNLGAGNVGVYLILSDTTNAASVIQDVLAALSATDKRPLTDTVNVYQATNVPYTLIVNYTFDGSSNVSEAIAAAVSEYQAWQDNAIGRAFNPDRLMAAMYEAGATRVTWGSGSGINDGPAEYTEIQETERCLGTITMVFSQS